MHTKKRAIEFLLFDGSMDGVVIASRKGSNTQALKIPRDHLSDAAGEIQKCNIGVYFLFYEKEILGVEVLYIGESSNLYSRLLNHAKNKEDWITTVAFCSSDLNKSILHFVEHELCQTIMNNGHDVKTKQSNQNIMISTGDCLFAEEFMEEIALFLGGFGYHVLRTVEKKGNAFFCQSKDADAIAFKSNEGFTVQKGSRVASKVAPAFKNSHYAIIREALENDGIIKDFVFQRDYGFSSPSAAASVVLGNSSNGRNLWKTADGVKLGDL
jgi:possible methionine sulfoxide reductase A